MHDAKNPTYDVSDCFPVEPTGELWRYDKQLRGVDSPKETGNVLYKLRKDSCHAVSTAPTRIVRVFDSLQDGRQFENAEFVVNILNAMYAIQEDDFKALERKTKWFGERSHIKTHRLNNPNDS
ncbi:unnamed protein product, partial [Aphanomyces euteiches]